MADLAFAPQHNMGSHLEKTKGNAEFHQIVDFLTSNSIHHALTVSPTIYASNIEQFQNTANSQTINDEKQIHATVDGKTVVITESSVRRDLLFTNDNGITCLTNAQTLDGTGFPHTKGPNFPDLSVDVEVVHKEGVTVWEKVQVVVSGAKKPWEVLDLKKVKTAQAKEIASLKKRVTKLEQRQSSRILGFYPFRVGTSRRQSLGRRNVSKQERKNLKSQQKFQDIDDLVDEVVKKRGSTTETVKTARLEVSTVEPKTPPTTTTLFDDEDVTIADNLVKMKNQKAKEKGAAFKDADDSARPIRPITTL
uniref:Uncharacterized protein n=1 Tax=Tanacetum cinerariifolium TaxID=118510 RepID=A0A6L2KEM9_TANCI|nr:hypothetical protein [Tanacetum cinerariifolium]